MLTSTLSTPQDLPPSLGILEDRFGRVHDYLRISLTDRCNLRCFYCMPDENHAFAPASHLMQREEIEALASIFVRMGIRKIRLTGGEPLMRRDAGTIIEMLGRLPVDLFLTTNAVLIHRYLDVLREAGVNTINVSLDSLQRAKFQHITRRDRFLVTWNNIQRLLREEMQVKINVVVTKELNDDEIGDFVAWTKDTPVEVRFIEFMPFSGNRWEGEKVVPLVEILARIRREYAFVPINGQQNDTAKHFRAVGHQGSFAVISTMSAPFCATCNRLRLTADGKLKNCLFSTGEIDLLGPLRRGEDVVTLIHRGVERKAKALGGQFGGDYSALDASSLANRSMIAIGG